MPSIKIYILNWDVGNSRVRGERCCLNNNGNFTIKMYSSGYLITIFKKGGGCFTL